MGFEGVSRVDQRTHYVLALLEGKYTKSELCKRFRISRPTGDKWFARFVLDGINGLEDVSSAPHKVHNKVPEEIITEILRVKREVHKHWGAAKIIEVVRRAHPEWKLPAPSTVSDYFAKNNLTKRRRNKRPSVHPGCPTFRANEPNDIWTVDYKGHFKLANGSYCYPLTIMDMKTKYLLEVEAHTAVSKHRTKDAFTRLFKQFGIPKVILSDNGVPFASNAISRLSELSAWWVRHGIYPMTIEPGKPQQNGAHERMHRTLKKEACLPPESTVRNQQARFNDFREIYNFQRPHEALRMKTPAELYQASERSFNTFLKPPEYPDHFIVRRVSNNGGIRLQGRRFPVSSVLKQQLVGLEEVDDGVFDVHFCFLIIGRLDLRNCKIIDSIKRVPVKNRFADRPY